MSTKKNKREHITPVQQDILSEQKLHLYEKFPEVFSEEKIDFEKLKTTLGEISDLGVERYSFSWAGKRDAIGLLKIPSHAALHPDKEDSINWDSTRNVFIEGENLEVLKLLYRSYAAKIKLIYIDPPYNTGRDFIYSDNFSDPLEAYLKLTSQKNEKGDLLTSNPETNGRYHSAWLSMMYPRLFVARQLLRDDGIIVVSIDDHEVSNLRLLMNEIFGEENFIATMIWQKVYAPKNSAKYFSEDHEYVIIYAKIKHLWLPNLMPRSEEADSRYSNPDNDPRGDWKSGDLSARNYYSKGLYEITGPTGEKFRPNTGRYWLVPHERFLELDIDNRIWWGQNKDSGPSLKRFKSEVKQGIVNQTLWLYEEVGHTQEAKKELIEYVQFENTENVLDTLKPTRLIQRILQIATNPHDSDIILDFFAGSATTGHAVLKQNAEDNGDRKFICVQIPELLPIPEENLTSIADIGKQRIKSILNKIDTERRTQTRIVEQEAPGLDLGFRIFHLEKSQFKIWDGTNITSSEEYTKQLELFVDLLTPGWKEEDVIWEVALKEGYSLSSLVEQISLPIQNTIWKVTDQRKEQSFWICLDSQLDLNIVQLLKLARENLFVCRDTALTDELAANFALQCHLKTL